MVWEWDASNKSLTTLYPSLPLIITVQLNRKCNEDEFNQNPIALSFSSSISLLPLPCYFLSLSLSSSISELLELDTIPSQKEQNCCSIVCLLAEFQEFSSLPIHNSLSFVVIQSNCPSSRQSQVSQQSPPLPTISFYCSVKGN